MNKKLMHFLILVCLMISSCSSKDKIANIDDYKAVYIDTPSLEVNNSIARHEISVPAAVINNKWTNSNMVLSRIPENILVDSSLNHSHKVQIFKGSGSVNNLLRTPVVYRDTLYVLDYSNNLHAYNVKDLKKPKWVVKIDNGSNFLLGGGITVHNNTIIVTHGSNIVTAIALDGTEIWKQKLSNITRSTPNIHSNKVFINTIDNRLYCLGLNTGSVLWFYQGAVDNLHTLQSPSPIVHNNLVINAFSLNEISALNIDNGQLAWNSDLSNYKISSTNINDIDLTPIINNSTLYVSSFAGDLSAINLSNGAVEWTINKAGSNIGMWSASNHVYTITNEGDLAAIYKLTGTVQWANKLIEMIPQKERKNISFTGPIMINGSLYIASSNGHLLKISVNTGKPLKIIPIDSNYFAFPIAVENNIYLLSRDGSLTLVH